MTTALSAAPILHHAPRYSYRITGSRYRFLVTTPDADPDLWDAYLAGARAAYARYGIERALDAAHDGGNTSLFFAAVDTDGNVVGGVRAQGPYNNVDEAHAVTEWTGYPGGALLRKMVFDRLPFGVAEMKTAWVGTRVDRSRVVSNAIARSVFLVATILGAQFLLATASEYALGRWASSGGRVAATIPPAPYPNPDSAARLLWWDRRTMLSLADPGVAPMMVREMAELSGDMDSDDTQQHLTSLFQRDSRVVSFVKNGALS